MYGQELKVSCVVEVCVNKSQRPLVCVGKSEVEEC